MFTYEQVRLIRKAAGMLAAGGNDDTSKKQVSSLVELASRATEVEEVCLDIDVRWADDKLSRTSDRNQDIARELKALMRQIKDLAEEEEEQLPGGKLTPEREQQLPETERHNRARVRRQMLCDKRATALRYVNKLRNLAAGDIEQL